MTGPLEEADRYRAAVDLVNGMIAAAHAGDLETAVGWVVEVHDPEAGSRQHVGPFPTAPAALAYAEAWEVELNSRNEPGEVPYVCTVYPLQPPDLERAQ